VAIEGGWVLGAIQLRSDGVIQAHVSMRLIDPDWRGHHLAAGGFDIRSRRAGYYERFGASRSPGHRLTRELLGLRATHSLAAR
jgi:hypothetical protein